jgi:glycosyltransferase involved in cell wall biosynthesis
VLEHSAAISSRGLRVLHVHSGNLYGGVESLLLTLNRFTALSANLDFAHALAFEGRLARELREQQGKVFIMGAARTRNPLSVLRARRTLNKIIERFGCEIAICHMPWAHALFADTIRHARVPVAFWMHGAASGHWLERWAARKQPALVLCNSKFIAKDAKRLFPQVRVEPFAIPIEISSSKISEAEIASLRRTVNTNIDSSVVTIVSRMEPSKGHLSLLEALSRIKARPNWTCWIVGGAQRSEEREYLACLEGYCSSHQMGDRVRFLGHRSDVDLVLRASNIYCQPNRGAEGFGLAIAEAAAAGLPIISTRIGAIPELVDDNGSILVEPGDVKNLAAAIEYLLDNPERQLELGRAARHKVINICNPRLQIRKLSEILQSVIQ